MAIRKTTVESFRKQLEQKREEIASDLRAATVELVNSDASYSDEIDQAAADVDKGLTLQMKNRERDNLYQIDAAIRRIEEGCFGECDRCGEDIAEARLRASLFATLCIDCKAEMESEDRRIARMA